MLSQIAARIADSGPIRFAELMAVALYHPEHGYYAKNTQQVGRGGDFFTSVSVGPLFGQLLARRFAAEWHHLGQPAAWRIMECGAHDGKLARDILDTLANHDPAAHAAAEYAIAEPLDRLRTAQREMLHDHPGKLRSVANAADLPPMPGIIFGNELLDALPFDVIEFRDGMWHECRIQVDESDQLAWHLCPPTDPTLIANLDPLGTIFPDGYRSELRTNYRSFLEPLRQTLTVGTMLWIDYGFTRDDYYHPDRTSGTLRTFSRHRAGEDPLAAPGDADITAHVDFTAVAEALESLGGKVARLQSQGTWLTTLARDWLLQQEGKPDAAMLRQFQTLTHPGHLGRSFQVIESSFETASEDL